MPRGPRLQSRRNPRRARDGCGRARPRVAMVIPARRGRSRDPCPCCARHAATGLWSPLTPRERTFVSLLTRFAPQSLTAEQYDNVVRRLNEEGISPADGLDYEVCFGSGDQHKVSLIWDSKEQFEAFAARLMPILGEF